MTQSPVEPLNEGVSLAKVPGADQPVQVQVWSRGPGWPQVPRVPGQAVYQGRGSKRQCYLLSEVSALPPSSFSSALVKLMNCMLELKKNNQTPTFFLLL